MLGRYLDLGNPVNTSHPLNLGLVSWCLALPNNEGGVLNLFDLCKRNHGTINLAPEWVAGKALSAGKCLDFEAGTGHYVDCGDPASLRLTEFTLAVWVKPESFTSNQTILAKVNAATTVRNYALDVKNTGEVRFYVTVGGAFNGIDPSSVALSTGVWAHLAVTHDGTTTNLYIDGVNRGTMAPGAPDTAGSGNCVIGRLGDFAGEYFDGVIDDVRIYSRWLSSDQAVALYTESLRGYPDTLRRWSRKVHLLGETGAAAPAAKVPYDLAHTPQHQAVMAM